MASGLSVEENHSSQEAAEGLRTVPSEQEEILLTCNTNGLEGKTKKKKGKKRKAGQETTTSGATEVSPKDQSSTSSTKSSFEEELDWCIAQLELGMLRPGASKPQKQQNEKNIRTLQATKTPVPKKRQLMRSLFGDYRSKMKQQPLPESLITKETKLEPAKPEVIETVGTYYRCSTGSKSCEEDSSFRFNFNISSK